MFLVWLVCQKLNIDDVCVVSRAWSCNEFPFQVWDIFIMHNLLPSCIMGMIGLDRVGIYILSYYAGTGRKTSWLGCKSCHLLLSTCMFEFSFCLCPIAWMNERFPLWSIQIPILVFEGGTDGKAYLLRYRMHHTHFWWIVFRRFDRARISKFSQPSQTKVSLGRDRLT